MEKLFLFEKSGNVDGFTVKPGFIGLVEDDQLTAVTSGWYSNNAYFVYRKADAEWKGDWEYEDTFPVGRVLEILDDYYDRQDWEKAVAEADEKVRNGEELFVSNETLHFTDAVAGEKCNNGGEYGFWTECEPTSRPGIFREHTYTTCDFDRCGTGDRGYYVMTVSDYERLCRESDAVEEAGCLY